MKASGKEVWHKVRTRTWNNGAGEVKIAREVAFAVNADGKIRGSQRWERSEKTAMEWRAGTLKAELSTAEAYRAHLRATGYAPGPAPADAKAPRLKTVMRQDWDGDCEAVDGCRVDPDGRCPHGAPSWQLVYGII